MSKNLSLYIEMADSKYASEFSAPNVSRMKKGLAPKVVLGQSYGGLSSYILHHMNPIYNGGGVYDLNNIIIVTPLMHQSILEPKFHFNIGRN